MGKDKNGDRQKQGEGTTPRRRETEVCVRWPPAPWAAGAVQATLQMPSVITPSSAC